MAAKQSISKMQLDGQMFEPMYETLHETKHKKKIALIGPAIDKFASHVRWGSRLSSSFYRTVGLNISLRTVTKTTSTKKATFDFVIWQFSPTLSPSLLKRLINGASAIIVACYGVSGTDSISQDKLNNLGSEHLSAAENSVEETESNILDIAMIEKSASHLKLPIAFIHFVESDTDLELVSSKDSELLSGNQDLAETQSELLKLGETEHSLHLGITSEQDCEYCLGQAFDYIAGHFASAA